MHKIFNKFFISKKTTSFFFIICFLLLIQLIPSHLFFLIKKNVFSVFIDPRYITLYLVIILSFLLIKISPKDFKKNVYSFTFLPAIYFCHFLINKDFNINKYLFFEQIFISTLIIFIINFLYINQNSIDKKIILYNLQRLSRIIYSLFLILFFIQLIFLFIGDVKGPHSKLFFYDFFCAFLLFRFLVCRTYEKIISVILILIISILFQMKFSIILSMIYLIIILLNNKFIYFRYIILAIITFLIIDFYKELYSYIDELLFFISFAYENANMNFELFNPFNSNNYLSLNNNFVAIFNRLSTILWSFNTFGNNILFGIGFENTLNYRFNNTQINGLIFNIMCSGGLVALLMLNLVLLRLILKIIYTVPNTHLILFLVCGYQLFLCNRFLSSFIIFLFLIFIFIPIRYSKGS